MTNNQKGWAFLIAIPIILLFFGNSALGIAAVIGSIIGAISSFRGKLITQQKPLSQTSTPLTDLNCASCGREYILGKTGQVMTSKVALSMMKMVIGSGGGGIDDPDGIYPANESEWNDKMRRTSDDSLSEIRAGLAKGQHRRWKCRSCGHIQDYTKY